MKTNNISFQACDNSISTEQDSSFKTTLLVEDKANVIVIDDEIMNIEIMQAMFEVRNVKSNMAMSGEQALTQLHNRVKKVKLGKAEMYKLLILDFSMPKMDGP